MSERDLIERLRARRKCQRCDCLSCGREGMGELHDHVCTDGPDCIETRDKLRAKNRNLRLLCGDAVDALRDRDATITRLSEALAEAEKKGDEDWQPIETAPKDGTIFLGFAKRTAGTGRFWISQCKWVGPSERHPGSSLDWYMWQDGWPQPTHWRPLPAPPRDLSQGGQHG